MSDFARMSTKKRSIKIRGHATSVSLEDEFFTALCDVAAHKKMTLQDLAEIVDAQRGKNNLSSALRIYILAFYRQAMNESKPAKTRKNRTKNRHSGVERPS